MADILQPILNKTYKRWKDMTGSHAEVVALAANSGVNIGAVTMASGAVASGAVASGAVASGAIASGAIVDGADVTQGALADAAVSTDASGSVSAKLRGLIKLATTAGSFLVRATTASGGIASGSVASGAVASGAIASGAVASGAVASGAIASGAFALGSITVPTTLIHGQTVVAAAGTEVTLRATATLYSGVRIKALHANTGWIYVGLNPVTLTTGFVLDAGEEVFLEIADPATVFIDASVNGEGVSYIGS